MVSTLVSEGGLIIILLFESNESNHPLNSYPVLLGIFNVTELVTYT